MERGRRHFGAVIRPKDLFCRPAKAPPWTRAINGVEQGKGDDDFGLAAPGSNRLATE